MEGWGGEEEDIKTFCKDAFEFRNARIVCDDNGAGVGVMGGLGGPVKPHLAFLLLLFLT